MGDNEIQFKKSTSEFEELIKKTKNLKQNIEGEIKKLNESKYKITDEITETFKKQHLYLDEKEKDLKQDLDLKITKYKDYLEKFLIESNNILSSLERIIQSIKNFGINKDNNKIKSFYYISEINKNIENSKNFSIKPIKNIDITFSQLFYTINYKVYYFNGIPIPKDIIIEKKDDKVIITWKIGDYRLKDLILEVIKYHVEIKDDKIDNKYQTSDKCIILEKYNESKIYEVKIRTVINEVYGDWSEIKRFTIDEEEHQIKVLDIIKENKISFFNPNISKAKKASLFANLFDNKNDSKEIYSLENLFKKSQGKLFPDNN